MKVLVLGVTGMLGNAVFRRLAERSEVSIAGTARSTAAYRYFDPALHDRIVTGVDVENFDSVVDALARTRPEVVVNAVGLIKQLQVAKDPLNALPINAILPHRLARLCAATNARLIHVSTDCVFSGERGNYVEADRPDADDLYGRSKLLGEVDYPNAVTLRTSIIGHELGDAHHALVDWFLSQSGKTRGFTRAIFSGVPTVELADVILDNVLPNPQLHGLYHVSAAPISKFDLLQLVARKYAKSIDIEADDRLVIDRSLDSTRFRQATGYEPAGWPDLIEKMRQFG